MLVTIAITVHKIDKNVISKIRLVGIVKQSCGSLSNPLDVIAREIRSKLDERNCTYDYAY